MGDSLLILAVIYILCHAASM